MEQTMNSNMQPAKRGIKKSWIILGIVVVLVLWMFSGYNGLVEKQELATTELANVQTQYQRRADMMPQLAKIVKAYAKHEKDCRIRHRRHSSMSSNKQQPYPMPLPLEHTRDP